MRKNTLSEIIRYFQSDRDPVFASEFTEFWNSMTEEEKEYYRTLDLQTGELRKEL